MAKELTGKAGIAAATNALATRKRYPKISTLHTKPECFRKCGACKNISKSPERRASLAYFRR